jgi:hypothetical protein
MYLGPRGKWRRGEGGSRAAARAGTPVSPPRTDLAVGDPRVMASCAIPGGVRSSCGLATSPARRSVRRWSWCLQLRDPVKREGSRKHPVSAGRQTPSGGRPTIRSLPWVLAVLAHRPEGAVNAKGRPPSLQPSEGAAPSLFAAAPNLCRCARVASYSAARSRHVVRTAVALTTDVTPILIATMMPAQPREVSAPPSAFPAKKAYPPGLLRVLDSL